MKKLEIRQSQLPNLAVVEKLENHTIIFAQVKTYDFVCSLELKELLRPFSPTFPTDDIHIRRGERILNPLFWAGAAGTVVLVPLYIAFFTGASKSFGTTLSDLLFAVPIAMLWTGFSFIVCLFNHHQWEDEIFEYKEKELARINAEIR